MDKQAVIEIVVKAVDRASSTFHSIGRALGGLGGVLSSIAGFAKNALEAIVGLAAGGIAVISDWVNMAAEFDSVMSGVNAVLAATPEQMAKLNEEALRLGRVTIFNAKEAAAALELLARMGLSYGDIMAGAGDAVMKLAAATGGHDEAALRGAAEVTAAAMNIFGMSVEQVVDVVDAIAGAIARSGMTMNDYRIALVQAGSQASLMGVDLDDLSTALAVMSQMGVRGERAGTGLRNMLQYLIPKTEDAAGAFEKLGFIVNGQNQFFDASTGKVKSLYDVVKILETGTAGLGEADRQAALHAMFGVKARQAINALLLAGSDAYKEMSDTMANTSAEDMAAKRLDNLKGAIELFSGEMETAKITLGEGFTPALQGIVLWAKEVLEKAQPLITAVGKSIPGALQLLKEKLLEIFGMGGSFDLAEKFKPLTDLLSNLSGDQSVTLDFAEPTGMDRLPAILRDKDPRKEVSVEATKGSTWDKVESAIKGVFDNIFGDGSWEKASDAVQQLVDNLPMMVDTVIGLAKSGAGLLEWLNNVATDVGEAKDGWDEFWKILSPVVDWLNTPLPNPFEALFNGGKEVGEWLKTDFGPTVTTAWGGLKTSTSETWTSVTTSIGTALSTVSTDVSTKAGEIWTTISTKWRETSTETTTKWGEITTTVSTSLQSAYDTTVEKMGLTHETIKTKWEESYDETKTNLDLILSDVKLKFDASLREVQDKMGSMARSIGEKWDEAKTKTATALADLVADVSAKFKSAYEDHVKPRMDDIKTWIGDKWQEAKTSTETKTGEIAALARDKFQEARTSVQNRMGEIATDVSTKIGEAWTSFSTNTASIVSNAQTEWPKVKSAISDSVRDGVDAAKTKLDEILTKAGEIATSCYDEAKKIGANLIQGIQDGWTGLLESVKVKIGEGVNAIIALLKSILGPFGSPSKKTTWMGAMMALGLVEGFVDTLRQQGGAIRAAAEGALTSMTPRGQIALDGRAGALEGMGLRASGAGGSRAPVINFRPTLLLQMGLAEIARMDDAISPVSAWKADMWSPAG